MTVCESAHPARACKLCAGRLRALNHKSDRGVLSRAEIWEWAALVLAGLDAVTVRALAEMELA